MELALALGLLGVAAEIGLMVGCYQWGAWKARTYVHKIAEEKQREAAAALAAPAARGSDLIDQL